MHEAETNHVVTIIVPLGIDIGYFPQVHGSRSSKTPHFFVSSENTVLIMSVAFEVGKIRFTHNVFIIRSYPGADNRLPTNNSFPED